VLLCESQVLYVDLKVVRPVAIMKVLDVEEVLATNSGEFEAEVAGA